MSQWPRDERCILFLVVRGGSDWTHAIRSHEATIGVLVFDGEECEAMTCWLVVIPGKGRCSPYPLQKGLSYLASVHVLGGLVK